MREESVSSYRSSNAFQLTRSLLVGVYTCTEDLAGNGEPPVRALRRASLAAVARLAEAAGRDAGADEERRVCLVRAREALREVALYLNVCQLRGHLPTMTAAALIGEQAEAAAEIERAIAAGRAIAS